VGFVFRPDRHHGLHPVARRLDRIARIDGPRPVAEFFIAHTPLRAKNIRGLRTEPLQIEPDVLTHTEDHRQRIAGGGALLQALAQTAMIARRDMKADFAHDVRSLWLRCR
jgi:hypothetical protein